jgi:sigma-E factor negative regulatory protein RseC
MSREETITHDGKVLRVSGDGTAEIEILVSEACAGCNAKAVCSPGKSETKVVTARFVNPLQPGDHVVVEMHLSQGFKALFIGYVFPFIVLISAFVIASVINAGELLSALTSFAAVGVYYVLVWMLRGRIGRKFEFNIKV